MLELDCGDIWKAREKIRMLLGRKANKGASVRDFAQTRRKVK